MLAHEITRAEEKQRGEMRAARCLPVSLAFDAVLIRHFPATVSSSLLETHETRGNFFIRLRLRTDVKGPTEATFTRDASRPPLSLSQLAGWHLTVMWRQILRLDSGRMRRTYVASS